jgi:hypothetical protein
MNAGSELVTPLVQVAWTLLRQSEKGQRNYRAGDPVIVCVPIAFASGVGLEVLWHLESKG